VIERDGIFFVYFVNLLEGQVLLLMQLFLYMDYRVLGILLFLFASTTGGSQVEGWKTLSLNDGLSDLQCFDVFSDSKGYIWIGTRAGVNRFDGKDVVRFNRSNGLMSDNVYSFFEDSKGRIWVNNLNGEPVFIEDGIVHNRYTDPYLEPLKTEVFKNAISEDKKGRLYFINQSPEISILENESVSSMDFINDKKDHRSQSFRLVEYRDVLILAYNKGFKVFDYDWNLLRETNWDNSLSGMRSCVVGDRIYFAFGNNLFCYNLLDLIEIGVPPLDNVTMITDLRSINNILHISSTHGIYKLINGAFITDDLEKFSGLSVSAIDKGKDGRFWIATREKGIYFESKSIVKPSVFSEYQDITYMEKVGEDSIYIGYDSDKLLLSHNGKTQDVQLDQKESFDIIKTLKVKDKLWVVSTTYLYNIEDNVTLSFHKRDGIYSDAYDRFYFPFHNGVMHIDYKGMTEELPVLKQAGVPFKSAMKNINLNQGYKCAIDKDGLVWVGTENGLYSILDTVLSKVDDPNLQGSIIDIKVGNSGLIGINYGIGLFTYDSAKNITKTIDLEDGLASANITNMCVHNNDIWVTHGLGISHIRIKNGMLSLIRNYGYAHGIPVGDITFIEYINEQVHFVVDKKAYTLSESKEVNDSLSIILDDHLVIKYVDEEVLVEFDCINYSFGSDMAYEYRLLPKDSTWTTTTDEVISYQYLPAKEYILEIRAKHPLNLANRIVRKPICIIDRWYDSYLFFGLLLVLLLSGVWLLLRIGVLGFNFTRLKVVLKRYVSAKDLPPLKLKDIKGVTKLINPADIVYIKASGNYVEYKTINELIMVRNTMSNTEKSLIKMPFLVRVHRSYIANLIRMKGISQNTIDLDGQSIPYSITYKEQLDNYVGELTA
jgi:hypothetical protein